MQASGAFWKSNAFTPSSARAVRPSAASARSRRVKRSVRAAEASAIALEPRILALLRASCLGQEKYFPSSAGSSPAHRFFGSAFLLSSFQGRLHLRPCLCRLRRSNSLVPLVATPRLRNTCRPERSVVLHRPTVAHQANHSVKRDGLTAAPYLKR